MRRLPCRRALFCCACCAVWFLISGPAEALPRVAANASYVPVTAPPTGDETFPLRLVKEPVVLAVPLKTGNSYTDRLFAAWMSGPTDANDPKDVQIRVSFSPDGGATWGNTTSLEVPASPTFNAPTVSGDPFFALDPLSNRVYLAHVAGGDEGQTEIALWSSPVTESNWTFSDHLCHTPFASENEAYAENDKPSVAVSPGGILYVAHYTDWFGAGGPSIHIHKRFQNNQWLNTGSGSPTGPRSGVYLIPPAGTEYQSPIVIAPDETNLYVVVRSIGGQGNQIVVAHLDKDGQLVSRKSIDGGPFADRASVGNTNLTATTNLMAAYEPVSKSIGIVWHSTVGGATDKADVKFVSYKIANDGFGDVKNLTSTSPGSQWTPSIYGDQAGTFLVTYYEAGSPHVAPFKYNFKAALLNVDGKRSGCDDVVISRTDVPSQPDNNLYKGTKVFELGEYQGVWYSSGTDSWYATFVQVDLENGVRTRRTYVARISPFAAATCARRRAWPIPYTIKRNAILHIDTELYGTGAALPASYDVEWRDKDDNLLSTSPTFDQRVPNSMDLYLRVRRPDDGACDVLAVHVNTIEPQAACNSVAGYCRRRAALHTAILNPVPPNTAVQLDAPEISADITYEWWSRPVGSATPATAIADSNHSSITVYPTVDMTYWVTMEDCVESVTSDTYVVKVIPAGAVTAQPTSQIVQPGGNAEVGVYIDPPPYSYADYTYEWHRGDDPGNPNAQFLGAGRAILRTNLQKNESLWCKVTKGTEVWFTNVAHIEVACVPIAITGSVQSYTPYVSRSDLATMVATPFAGRSPFTYRWYERFSDEPTPHGMAWRQQVLAKVMTRPLTYYHATVEDYCGNTATLDPIAIHLCVPTIDAEPQDAIVGAHKTAELSLLASPAFPGQPLTVRWHRSSDQAQQTILGTGTTLHPVAGDQGQTDSYYAAVSMDCDGTPKSVRTRDATVTACMLSAAGVASQNIAKNQIATVSVSVSDAAVPPSELYYKWYRGTGSDSVLLSEGTGQPQIMDIPQTTTQYWVNVSDGVCAVDSNVMTVHVCVPVISGQPQSTVIPQNGTAPLTVTVPELTGEPFTYQWYVGSTGSTSVPVSGATSATFTTPPLTATTWYWVRVTGQCGAHADSNSVIVTVCTPPAITALSQTQFIRSGASATLGVNATGSNLTYQWYEGSPGNTSAPVANGTGAAVTVTPSSTRTYWVRVKSAGVCAVDSAAVTVDVCTDPVITTHPASVQIRSGASTMLSVVSSSSPVTYQWITAADGFPVQNGTAASVTVTPAADTQYKVRVLRNACSIESNTATVTVCSLTASLSSSVQNATKGQLVTLYASVANSRLDLAATRYTWYRGSPGNWTLVEDNPGRQQWTEAPTATTQYFVRVSDGACTYDSNIVTVNVCIPQISTQPAGSTIASGQTATLSITSTQIAGETVQWYKGARGDTSQPATNGTSYTLATQPTVTTSYWARLTGSCAAADSTAATVIVCNTPTITVTPTRYIRYGQSATHQVTATGANLTYQWYVGSPGDMSSPIFGATQPSRTFNPATTTTYWARVVSEGLCAANSTAMVVDVCTDPVITVPPASTTILAGGTATLNVTVSTPGVTYQWYFAGTNLPVQAATGPALAVSPADDTQYYVRVTRNACSTDSAPATVTVCRLSAAVSGGGNVAALQSTTLTASASNVRGSNVNYTWYRGIGASAVAFDGGINRFQTIVNPSTTTQYWVHADDGTCNANSTAVTANVCVPTITSQPQNKSINSGQTATLTVAATGDNLGYRWYVGSPGSTSQPAPGASATTASYTTPPLSATTSYWARVTGCSAADSTAATVAVCVLPAISSGPSASSQRVPSTWGWVSVTATGTSLAYQWYRGQSGDTTQPVNGANSATYSFVLSQSAYFWVRISNACGSINSPTVLHPVYPQVTAPTDVGAPPNGTPTLTVLASGTTLTYQWYRGYSGDESSIITGATSASYNVPPVTTTVRFWCKVTSVGVASINTDTITVSVCEGPAIYGPGAYYYGYNTWRLYINIYTEDIGNIEWYTGVPGNAGQSVLRDSGGAIWVSPTQSQVWWARAWNASGTCYSDTGGTTVYPIH